MKAYRIYLTKSYEIAALLADRYLLEMKESDGSITKVGHGIVNGTDEIPAIFHNREYCYCIVERKANEPSYTLIFA